MIQIPCEEIFGHPKGIVSRCLGVGIPTHKVFGRLGIYPLENLGRLPNHQKKHRIVGPQHLPFSSIFLRANFCETWMSQKISKWLVNGLYLQYTRFISIGYNPFKLTFYELPGTSPASFRGGPIFIPPGHPPCNFQHLRSSWRSNYFTEGSEGFSSLGEGPGWLQPWRRAGGSW